MKCNRVAQLLGQSRSSCGCIWYFPHYMFRNKWYMCGRWYTRDAINQQFITQKLFCVILSDYHSHFRGWLDLISVPQQRYPRFIFKMKGSWGHCGSLLSYYSIESECHPQGWKGTFKVNQRKSSKRELSMILPIKGALDGSGVIPTLPTPTLMRRKYKFRFFFFF